MGSQSGQGKRSSSSSSGWRDDVTPPRSSRRPGRRLPRYRRARHGPGGAFRHPDPARARNRDRRRRDPIHQDNSRTWSPPRRRHRRARSRPRTPSRSSGRADAGKSVRPDHEFDAQPDATRFPGRHAHRRRGRNFDELKYVDRGTAPARPVLKYAMRARRRTPLRHARVAARASRAIFGHRGFLAHRLLCSSTRPRPRSPFFIPMLS